MLALGGAILLTVTERFGLIESPTTLHNTLIQATGNPYISGRRQSSICNVYIHLRSWSYGNPTEQM